MTPIVRKHQCEEESQLWDIQHAPEPDEPPIPEDPSYTHKGAQAISTYKRLPVTRAQQTAAYADMKLSAPSQGAKRFVFYAPMWTTWRQQQHVVDIIATFWSSEFWQVHPNENKNDEAGHIDYFTWVAATILFELRWGAILPRNTKSTKEAKQASG